MCLRRDRGVQDPIIFDTTVAQSRLHSELVRVCIEAEFGTRGAMDAAVRGNCDAHSVSAQFWLYISRFYQRVREYRFPHTAARIRPMHAFVDKVESLGSGHGWEVER